MKKISTLLILLTIITTAGLIGLTVTNQIYEKTTNEKQSQSSKTLDLKKQQQFSSDFPEKIFSILVLSPIDVVVQGPNGEILSKNQNDFGEDNAEYDDDPSDPDDPIDITIADPPDGKYTISYIGTATGEYTIIMTYADEDETVSSTRDGITQAGKIETEVVLIENNTSSLIDDPD